MDALLTSLQLYASKTGDGTVERDNDSGCLILRYKNIPLVLKSQNVSSTSDFTGTLQLTNDSKTVSLEFHVMKGSIYGLCTFTVNGASTVYSDEKGIRSLTLYFVSFYSLTRNSDQSITVKYYLPSINEMVTKHYKNDICIRDKVKTWNGVQYMYKYSPYALRKTVYPLTRRDISIPIAFFHEDGTPTRVAVMEGNTILYTAKYFIDSTMIMYDQKDSIVYQGEYVFCKPFFFLPHGKGEQYLHGKKLYSGHFEYGVRSGKGKLYYSNGKVKYDGNWECDRPHGAGTICNKDGQPYCQITSRYGDFTRFLRKETVFEYFPSEGLFSFLTKAHVEVYSQINQIPFSSRQRDIQFTYDLSGLTLTDNQLKKYEAPVVSPHAAAKIQKAEALRRLLLASGGNIDDPNSVVHLTVPNGWQPFSKTAIDFSLLGWLEELVVGDSALQRVTDVVARFLLRLRTIAIGDNACSCASVALGCLPALRSLTFGEHACQISSTIAIENCITLEFIHFSADCFGKLLSLSLTHHPALKTVFFGSNAFTSLTSLSITHCPMLGSIELMKDSLPSISFLSLKKLPLFSTIAGGNGCFTNLSTLVTLEIRGISGIFSSS